MQSEQETQIKLLRDVILDESWFTSSIVCEVILKNLDEKAWKKAVTAGIDIASKVDDFSMYDSLWETWTSDMAIIAPSVLAELNQMQEEGEKNFDKTLLLGLLCRATVIAASISSLETRIEEYYNNESKTNPTEC